MSLGRKFQERVKELVHNPDFQKPLSELNKDYSKQGTIKLVTKISTLCQVKTSSMVLSSSV